jgi:stage II sporulation protein M
MFKIVFSGYKDYIVSIIGSLKHLIFISIFLFITGILLSIFDFFKINNFIEIIVNNLLTQFTDARGTELFLKIFIQNTKATLYIVILGIFFSIFPIVAILLNGAMIGYILVNIESYSNFTLVEGILYMLPHGVFEIPAVILAVSLGIKLGLWPYQNPKIAYIKSTMLRSVHCYLLLIMPLLLLAGVIETYNIEQLRRY